MAGCRPARPGDQPRRLPAHAVLRHRRGCHQGDARGTGLAIAEFERASPAPTWSGHHPQGADGSHCAAPTTRGGQRGPGASTGCGEAATGKWPPAALPEPPRTRDRGAAIDRLVVLIEGGLKKLQLLRLVQGISLVLLVIVGAWR